VIVKNRPGIAESRLIVDALLRQILHNADDRPGQGETKAQQHQQTDRNIHDSHRPI
jgi:hypothetical protein